jgi:Asp-tRNA(Asn)/Glu-tRNA(Gln) amidotransferase A subunit family amidase
MARTVADCVAMLEALVPEFEPAPRPGLDDLRVAVAWADEADDGVRERVEEAAARFPHAERIEFPHGRGNLKVFMREIAEVHATLFAEQPDAYGADVARKIRDCLEVTDSEVAEAERVRASYRDEAAALLEGYDLLVTPTQGSVAPTYEEAADDSLRAGITSFTNPFNALGWPALALPCGTAEHGLPASIQLVGRPGEDAHVLAAGAALEARVAA